MERLSLTNEHLEGDNNAYLFDGERTVLVDAGEHGRRARDTLETGLAAHGRSTADIDDIVLTHWHSDHSGLAATVREASDATIHIHEADAPLARGGDAWDRFLDDQRTLLHEWGVPQEKRDQLFDYRSNDDVTERPTLAPLETFTDGDEISAGDAVLKVLHTPGHTAGSASFAFEGERGRELIAGDTLLPEYTPNVGGSDVRLDRPLARYLHSLDRVEAGDYEYAWPGHREPIADPGARIEAIRAHHEKRAATMLEVVREMGAATPWDVASEVFGELRNFHILVGAGEAFAHLDHLRQQGDLRLGDGRYRLTAAAERTDPRETWPLELTT